MDTNIDFVQFLIQMPIECSDNVSHNTQHIARCDLIEYEVCGNECHSTRYTKRKLIEYEY